MRGWIVDVLGGVLVGGAAGVIAALNVVIFAGIEDGYEATPAQVFAQNPVVGVLATVLLVGGLVGGVVLARYLRRQRWSVRQTR